MPNKKSSSYDNFKDVVSKTPVKEKALLIAQGGLSIILLILVILSWNNILAPRAMQISGLSLLILLLIVAAIRMFSTRKIYAILYIILAVVVAAFLVTIIFHLY